MKNNRNFYKNLRNIGFGIVFGGLVYCGYTIYKGEVQENKESSKDYYDMGLYSLVSSFTLGHSISIFGMHKLNKLEEKIDRDKN